MIQVGDVFITKTLEEDYAAQFVASGEIHASGYTTQVRFEPGACFLVIRKCETTADKYDVECMALETGYCFSLRGETSQIVATCHVLRGEEYITL